LSPTLSNGAALKNATRLELTHRTLRDVANPKKIMVFQGQHIGLDRLKLLQKLICGMSPPRTPARNMRAKWNSITSKNLETPLYK